MINVFSQWKAGEKVNEREEKSGALFRIFFFITLIADKPSEKDDVHLRNKFVRRHPPDVAEKCFL